MRQFGIRIRRNPNISGPVAPEARLRLVKSLSRRRLHDSLAEVFFRACEISDLNSAADLLAVMEGWHSRRAIAYGRERRISDAGIKAMRAHLDRLIAKG